LISALQSDGVDVLVPILRPDADLGWARHAGNARFRPARFGLLEPTTPDLGVGAITRVGLAFVPALAVDRRGRRLGRGGGSFDRALTRVGPAVPVVAVVFDNEIIGDVPSEPHDRPVTGALTPSGFLPLPAPPPTPAG
jgi:5-formyltetrahydrofolate cyclo-ligase